MQKTKDAKDYSHSRRIKAQFQRRQSIKKMVREHLKDIKMFRELGFHYEGGQFVVSEEEFFKVASA